MKRYGLISILLGLGILNSFSQDSIVSIPDTTFLYALIDEGVDTNEDSLISYEEAESVINLYLGGDYLCGPACSGFGNIISLEGIETFVNLDTLDCSGNRLISLDVSNNISLRFLNCSYNQLESINVSGCKNLTVMIVGANHFAEIDLSTCSALEYLNCGRDDRPYGYLTNLDVSKNHELKELRCDKNLLTNLNVSECTQLKFLNCRGNQITSLDVSKNTALTELICFSNQLTSLDVSKNTALTVLYCSGNQITSLDVSNNTALTELECGDNQITSLNVSNNTDLTGLYCNGNQITSLDISNNTKIESLWIRHMPTLNEVCVWTTQFPTVGVEVDKDGSPNVQFTTECATSDVTQLYEYVSIYPNPTNTFLTIETGISGLYDIEILSLNGRLLYQWEYEEPVIQLDLPTFQKGVYFITIRSKDFITTRKIVKL